MQLLNLSYVPREYHDGVVTSGIMSKREKLKQRLCPPQNMFWMIWPSLMFFKIIGLATLTVRDDAPKKKWQDTAITFAYSKLGLLYNVLLIGITIITNYICIPFRYNYQYENKTTITTSIEILQGVLGTLVICTGLLTYCTNQTILVRIANNLMYFERELRHTHRPVQRERRFYSLLVACLFNWFLFAMLLLTDVWAFASTPVSWMTDIVPSCFVGWILTQYFLVVSLVEADFIDVNRAIRGLSRSWSGDVRPQSLRQTRRVFVSGSTIQPLLQLRDLHYHLCEVSSDVSEFYSIPILSGISLLFLALIYNCYYLIAPLVVDDDALETILLANTVCWIVFLLYPALLLTSRITRVLKEIGRTGNIVHALLSCAIDQDAKLELEQFSLQLLHRKITFTANGYFVLDNTLFHTMVGAATTYLVILIQFHEGKSLSAGSSCNCTKQ